MENKKSLVFAFMCYKEETPQGDMTEPVNVEMFGTDAAVVEKQAKEFCGRENAKLQNIVEMWEPEPNRPKYLCIVQGFETQVGGQLVGMVQCHLWVNDPKEAMERAKKYIVKKFYRFRQVVEKKPTEE